MTPNRRSSSLSISPSVSGSGHHGDFCTAALSDVGKYPSKQGATLTKR